jgi:hypothetical protein
LDRAQIKVPAPQPELDVVVILRFAGVLPRGDGT